MKQITKNVSPMSNEGRNTYVLEHLTDAMLQLLSDKQIEEISIRELCDAAGVGRASFYRNFESKEDILRRYINKIFQEWPDKDGELNNSLDNFLYFMFLHFEKHREEAYGKAYVAYALYGWIEVWFQRGMQETAEEIAGIFTNHGL